LISRGTEALGQRESGTARLEEGVTAYRDALKEYTRERVPLDWAMTQNNLGNALRISVPWRSIRWTLWGEAEPRAVVEFRMDIGPNEGLTWFRYDVDHFSQRTGSQHYPVSMVTTPCQFGGSRWWWLCPATGRRVG
jgi:hypothetical protein